MVRRPADQAATPPPADRPWLGPQPLGRPPRHDLGRVGFETGSESYERARPDYPEAAVERIVTTAGIGPGTRVADLAAGTGKLTRRLEARGATCIAVEPSEAMRLVCRRVLRAVPVIGGVAEKIPLATGSVDVVVVGQAFHWFEAPRALDECARVLRPRGWLVLIWNERDESDPTMAELVRITKWDRNLPYPMGNDFGVPIRESGLFGPVERSQFRFVQPVDRPRFVEQVATRSYVQVMDEAERQALLDRVASLAATLEEPIRMPYVTDLFCARASPSC